MKNLKFTIWSNEKHDDNDLLHHMEFMQEMANENDEDRFYDFEKDYYEILESYISENNDFIEYVRSDLNIELYNNIYCIADIERWDGRVSGYKVVGTNIKECLYSDCDYATWYVDKYNNVRFKGYHHDGCDTYLYRVLKEDLSCEQINNFEEKLYSGNVTTQDISRYTKEIGSHILEVYGF